MPIFFQFLRPVLVAFSILAMVPFPVQAERGLAPGPESVRASASTSVQLEFNRVPLPDRLCDHELETGVAMSAEQAVQAAFEHNPSLQAARERVAAARGSFRSHSAANNPEFSLGATWVPDGGSGGTEARSQFPDTDETAVKYTFPTSGRRRHRTRAARAELDEALAQLALEELELRSKVKQAYADLQVGRETMRVLEDSYRIALTLAAATRDQHRLGLVPETNVLRTRIDTAQAEQELLRSRADARAKEEAVGLLAGLPSGRRVRATDALEELPAPPPLDRLWVIAEAARPEVRMARATIEAARADVDLQRADRMPDLTVQTAFIDGLTNSGNPPVKAWVSLPLWDRGLVGGQIDRAKAEVRVREQLLEQARRQVRSDVTTAVNQLEAARNVLALSRDEVLPFTRALLDKARGAYAGGLGTLLEVLDAQRVYRQASLDRLRALGDVARATAVLERAVASKFDTGTTPSRSHTNEPVRSER